ncbi:hypothetical protein IWW34DRAFT_624302, partial [Fusarium oxysporum f. sp. albedinis]
GAKEYNKTNKLILLNIYAYYIDNTINLLYKEPKFNIKDNIRIFLIYIGYKELL